VTVTVPVSPTDAGDPSSRTSVMRVSPAAGPTGSAPSSVSCAGPTGYSAISPVSDDPYRLRTVQPGGSRRRAASTSRPCAVSPATVSERSAANERGSGAMPTSARRIAGLAFITVAPEAASHPGRAPTPSPRTSYSAIVAPVSGPASVAMSPAWNAIGSTCATTSPGP
jgi:hypothetical protein